MRSRPPFRSRSIWIQSHLGKNDKGQLCITPPEWPPSHIVPPEKPYILATPDEILSLIVEFLSITLNRNVHDHAREEVSTYGDLAAMALVCRRFHRIAVQFLYAWIQLYSGLGEFRQGRLKYREAQARLHETLRERKHLRQHCRHLVCEFGPSCRAADNADFASIAIDLASWLINTKTFSFFGFFDGVEIENMAADMLLTASQNMRQLGSISIFRQTWGGLHLHRIYSCLQDATPNLTTLSIGGCPSATRSDYPLYRTLLDANIITRSSMRTLQLNNMVDSPRVVAAFIAWIDQLEHFCLEWGPEDPQSPDWSLSVVADILAPHRQYIRSIKLSKLSKPGLGCFDTSQFPKLEKLTLHTNDLEGIDPKRCLQLRTPVLKEVVLIGP